MNKKTGLAFVLCILSFAVALAYFIDNENTTIYGDDLDIYFSLSKGNGISGLFTNLSNFGKLRPVSAFAINLSHLLFDKNLHNYFLFNVGIQSLIIVAFTFTLNLFLRNALVSWLLALVVGLSRFSHFNIAQMFNGGPLEGLGLLFFVFSLYSIFKFMLDEDNSANYSMRNLWWALFFANVNLYVHERYITVLGFILFLALFYPLRNKLPLKHKIAVATISGLLILANYILKTYVCHINFFLGTGGDSNMTFDVERMFGFFQNAILSMVQYNSGEQGWSGLNFNAVPVFHQVLAGTAIGFILLILILFFITAQGRIKDSQEETEAPRSRYIVAGLFVLIVFCLVPAISTIRLEQRWLQAPFAAMFLMVVYAFHNIRIRFRAVKNVLFAVFVVCFFVSDYYYLISYKKYSYWNGAEYTAKVFTEAYHNGMIQEKTQMVCVFVEDRVHFPSGAFYWILGEGKLFEYYRGGKKQIELIDVNMFKDKDQLPYVMGLNKETGQVIKWDGGSVSDITDKILSERDKFLNGSINQD